MQNLPGTVLPTEDITQGFGVLHPSIRATNGLTLAQAFALLSDPANTGVIEFWYGEMMDRYEGYTRLTTLMERDGQVSASLMKEASADV